MASICICNLELFHKKSNTTGATIGAETVYPFHMWHHRDDSLENYYNVKDRATRTSLKTRGEPGSSGRIDSFCSNSGTGRGLYFITLSVLHYIVCTSLHCLYIITLYVHHYIVCSSLHCLYYITLSVNVMMYRQCNDVQTM
jgi:hypothetical protein